MRIFIPFFIFLTGAFSGAALAQGYNPIFGQSTLGFNTHNWVYISSDNFDAYYYGDNQQLAQLSLVIAEKELKELESIIDYRLGNRSQIVLFSNAFDLKNSNILRKIQHYHPGGFTYSTENKIVTAFNGNKNDLRISIRRGAAEILVNELMHGGSFQDRLRSNTLLYMPEWFYKGLLSYLSDPWNTKIDDELRDGISSGRLSHISLLSGDDARLAGHSWWNYIAETYGNRRISDILYLTRVSRGYDNALTFVLGVNSRNVFTDWVNYYKQRYAEDPGHSPSRTAIEFGKPISAGTVSQIRLSPDAKELLLSTQLKGKMYVWLIEIHSKKKKVIYSSGYSQVNAPPIPEPIIAWHPSGKEIHLFLNQSGKIKHVRINPSGKRLSSKHLKEFSVIHTASFHPDGKRILISAVKSGQSDLYLINENKVDQLTNDPFDEIAADFSQNGDHIYFSSNRQNFGLNYQNDLPFIPSDSVSFDIYSMPYPTVIGKMQRITSTPFINEVQPKTHPNNGVSYLSDNNGIYNLYVTLFEKEDSTYVYHHYPLSNFNRNIIQHDHNASLTHEATLVRFNGHYFIDVIGIAESVKQEALVTQVRPTAYRVLTRHQALITSSENKGYLIDKQEEATPADSTLNPDKKPKRKGRYEFQSEFPDLPNKQPSTRAVKKREVKYEVNSKPSKLVLFPDFLATQLLDNSIINTPYYINDEQNRSFNTFARPNINARLEAGIHDIVNGHSFILGGRLPLGLNGTDVYLQYINRKHRISFGANMFRSSRLIEAGGGSNRITIQEIRPFVSIPFKNANELRISSFMRFDRSVETAVDLVSLGAPDTYYRWGGARIELIHDKCVLEELNFPVGIKAKAYAETYQNINKKTESVYIIGIDLRWYKKLHHKILWANRLSGAFGVGSNLVNYTLGGTENWVGNKYNESLSQSPNHSFIFNSLVTGVRGFPQNIRNGGNNLVINSEIRIPISSYLFQNPTNTPFLRTLQWVAFCDIGSAWNGLNPFGSQHYNTRFIDQGGVGITVTNKNDPFVYGIGTGVRSRIMAYYMRLDMAWGIENMIIANEGKGILHFSLGHDF